MALCLDAVGCFAGLGFLDGVWERKSPPSSSELECSMLGRIEVALRLLFGFAVSGLTGVFLERGVFLVLVAGVIVVVVVVVVGVLVAGESVALMLAELPPPTAPAVLRILKTRSVMARAVGRCSPGHVAVMD